MRIHHLTLNCIIATLLAVCVSCQQQASSDNSPQNWRDRLRQELPALGHRNWIVVADSAYPKQSAPGIETVVTGAQQLDVLKEVLEAIDSASHIRAVVMLDQELDNVDEADAPGISEYRQTLQKLLSNNTTKVMLHEEIISELDEGSKLFNVLLLKTNMTIPYTSVFLQLDCGYWDAESEARLRDALK
ncbi:MAG: hypothetical protein CMJ72_06640 [Planctomycetaceae bacterium]|nr:hypothetical protein [Planctomycetaceae bacterium]MCH2596268.1 hypothetical protein [Pirellulales bacterium]HCK41204.1 hypothetical protein [Planctomycetaceae bacterium]